MHVDDALRSCLLVKVVHILGAEEQAVFQRVFKFREREVRRVGFGCRSNPPTHGIELPHQPGITMPRMRRGDLLDPVVPPEPTHATERRNPAFGAYACPGKNEDSISGGN